MKKKFRIDLDVKHCEGYQTFQVEANSQEEAFKEFNKGNSVIIDSEVEVQSLCDADASMFSEWNN